MTYEKRKHAFISAFIVAAVVLSAVLCFGVCGKYSTARADEFDVSVAAVGELNCLLDAQASIAQSTPVTFDIPSEWQYGTEPNIPVPRLKHGDDSAVSFDVSLGDVIIATELNILDIPTYINKYMPTGEYVLTASIIAVTVSGEHEHWWTGELASDDDGTYDPIIYKYEFTVTDGSCLDTVAEFTESLNNRSFEYIYDGSLHLLPSDYLAAALDGVYDRGTDVENNYWATDAGDQYFDKAFTIEYNIAASGTAHYHTEEELANKIVDDDCKDTLPIEGGKYKIYYRLRARNYLPTTADDEPRSDMFYVYVLREVQKPAPSAEYTGEHMEADVTDNAIYTVLLNEGGTDVGEYDLVLVLNNPDLYMWKGQKLDARTAEITSTFTVTKASNKWLVVPDVVRWKEGEYDPQENVVIGEALFGEVNIVILDSDDKVVYNRLSGINKLQQASAGTYTLIAYVAETDNYSGMSGDAAYTRVVRVYPKEGMAWWGIMLIVLSVVCAIALALFLLNEFGVIRLMSKKQASDMRTKANMDATLAAVRLSRSAREGKTEKEVNTRPEKSENAVAPDNAVASDCSYSSEPDDGTNFSTDTEAAPTDTAQQSEPEQITEYQQPESEQAETEQPAEQSAQSEEYAPAPEQPRNAEAAMPSADELREQFAAYAAFNAKHKFEDQADENEKSNSAEIKKDSAEKSDGGEYVPQDGAIFLDDDE